MKAFTKGTTARFKATFIQDGVLVDPVTVTASTYDGSGTQTDYVMSDPELSKLQDGVYQLEVTLDQDGFFDVRFVGSGTYDGAQETRVLVQVSNFV